MVGVVKIFGRPPKLFKEQKKKFFDKYGIDRKGIRSIGFAEIMGGVAVLFWNQNVLVARTGAITLLLVTAGAIYFHFVFDKKPEPQAAITMFVLSAVFLASITFF